MANTSIDKDKLKVVLFEGIHTSAVENFKAQGYTNIELLKSAPTGDDLLRTVAGAHFIGIRSRTQLTEEVFDAAQKLVAVGCFCIGTNQVDLVAARKRGIAVFNAPFSNTRSVAELVLAETILLMRGIAEKNAAAHRGEWMKTAANSFEVRGKTLGIIGYGNIGSQLGVLAESVGMKVVFYDIESKLPIGNAVPKSSMDALLTESDVVSLHVPATPVTHNMLGKAQMAKMKQGAKLINASRGTVVEIDALAQALESGQIGGAAIDVFPQEPASNKDEFLSPLRAFDNVILTPHIGGSTLEAQNNIALEVSGKVIKYSDTGSTLSSVNFPEVSLPEHPGKHRLLHIHRNVPGVMSEINEVFSSSNINISGQYLQTNEDIGYVVIDVDQQYSELALARLREVAGTIKARVLF